MRILWLFGLVHVGLGWYSTIARTTAHYLLCYHSTQTMIVSCASIDCPGTLGDPPTSGSQIVQKHLSIKSVTFRSRNIFFVMVNGITTEISQNTVLVLRMLQDKWHPSNV